MLSAAGTVRSTEKTFFRHATLALQALDTALPERFFFALSPTPESQAKIEH